jgi:hypothetical protein
VYIPNIVITFTSVGIISATEVLQLHSEMETWFEAYYNVEQNTSDARTLQRQEQQYRTLQFRVPAVLNMKTVYDVSNQDTSTNRANTVTYTQNLVYEKTSDAQKPEDYVVLPFVDTPYKAQLMKSLKANIASFANLTAISQPVHEIMAPITPDETSWSLIIFTGIIGLLLLACGAYGADVSCHRHGDRPVVDENVRTRTGNAVQQPIENVPYRPDNEIPPFDDPSPIQRSNDYIVHYKDQARSVVVAEAGEIPIVHAMANPQTHVRDHLNNMDVAIATIVPTGRTNCSREI